MEYGLENAPERLKDKVRSKINKIRNSCSILPLYDNGVANFAKFKKYIKDTRNLKKEEMRQFNVDILLASIAIVENAILISADKIYSEIARIDPQFQYENWTSST